jgi:hypothetical protein
MKPEITSITNGFIGLIKVTIDSPEGKSTLWAIRFGNFQIGLDIKLLKIFGRNKK